MALKTLVKVGNITNLSDARYCAGMGVDFLGFRIVEGQPGAITVKTFQEIRGWITGPQVVAEIYGLSSPDLLAAIIENFQPDYFELSVEDYHRVGSAVTLPYILSVEPGQEMPSQFGARPAYILTDVSGPAKSKLIPEHELLAPVASADQLHLILSQTGISGVALNGGSEIRPGLRNYDDLAGILEALEVD